jgi:hypothetical protein
MSERASDIFGSLVEEEIHKDNAKADGIRLFPIAVEAYAACCQTMHWISETGVVRVRRQEANKMATFLLNMMEHCCPNVEKSAYQY